MLGVFTWQFAAITVAQELLSSVVTCTAMSILVAHLQQYVYCTAAALQLCCRRGCAPVGCASVIFCCYLFVWIHVDRFSLVAPRQFAPRNFAKLQCSFVSLMAAVPRCSVQARVAGLCRFACGPQPMRWGLPSPPSLHGCAPCPRCSHKVRFNRRWRATISCASLLLVLGCAVWQLPRLTSGTSERS